MRPHAISLVAQSRPCRPRNTGPSDWGWADTTGSRSISATASATARGGPFGLLLSSGGGGGRLGAGSQQSATARASRGSRASNRERLMQAGTPRTPGGQRRALVTNPRSLMSAAVLFRSVPFCSVLFRSVPFSLTHGRSRVFSVAAELRAVAGADQPDGDVCAAGVRRSRVGADWHCFVRLAALRRPRPARLRSPLLHNLEAL